MRSLILHPACAGGPIHTVEADIIPTLEGCKARFRLEGELAKLIVPARKNAERADDLWTTTCFEIFWQQEGGTAYREFNLSPSGRWACYYFDDVRTNRCDGPVEGVAIDRIHDADELTLEVNIIAQLPVPAAVALNAVVREREGNIQFWALAFADGQPDFHSPQCRALNLAGRL